MEGKEISFMKVRDLLKMLTGDKLPPGMKLDRQPNLSSQEAFSVIWFLQEHLGVLPTNYEMCDACNTIYDEHKGGFYLDVDSYHEESDWYDRRGVTEEMVRENAGRHFCSSACECGFWSGSQTVIHESKLQPAKD